MDKVLSNLKWMLFGNIAGALIAIFDFYAPLEEGLKQGIFVFALALILGFTFMAYRSATYYLKGKKEG